MMKSVVVVAIASFIINSIFSVSVMLTPLQEFYCIENENSMQQEKDSSNNLKLTGCLAKIFIVMLFYFKHELL